MKTHKSQMNLVLIFFFAAAFGENRQMARTMKSFGKVHAQVPKRNSKWKLFFRFNCAQTLLINKIERIYKTLLIKNCPINLFFVFQP